MTRPSLAEIARIGFHDAPDATLVLANRVVLGASARVLDVFGWTPKELEGRSIRDLYPGQTDFDLIGEKARLSMQLSPIYSDTRLMRRKDGTIVWVEAHGRSLDQSDPMRLAVWAYRLVKDQTMTPDQTLTAAEKRVAGYMVNGFTSKEIAQALSCSPRTIEAHRANMIRKMGVRNSVDLVSRLLSAAEPGTT